MSLTPNQYLGLWEGPIDHDASSVINAVFENEHDQEMVIGDTVHLVTPPSSELLPRVDLIFLVGEPLSVYGIAVGGDVGGIYPVAGGGFDEEQFIAIKTGQGVRICTQGRCIARVNPNSSEINVGDPLSSTTGASLRFATSGELVVARALQFVAQKSPPVPFTFIAVDVKREGILP